MVPVVSARERIHSLLARCSHRRPIDQCHAQLATTGTLLSSGALCHNLLIRARARTADPISALPLFLRLLRSSLAPDSHTFPSLLKACSLAAARPQGLSLHAHALRLGLAAEIFVSNALIAFYAAIGQPADARTVLSTASAVDTVSFNTIISLHVRAGDLGVARKVFDGMPQRDEISWSSMIAGYVQAGRSREALRLFSTMQRGYGPPPSGGTLVSLLAACAHLGALEQGKWVHRYLGATGERVTVYLGGGLIDMYCKCGEVELGLEVFRGMRERNLLVWTAMVKGLAMYGRGREALALFREMESSGLVPDDIAILGAICACTHAGLVDEGRRIFGSMSSLYGIVPKVEHYGCMVDLLSRNGQLREAFDLVNSMPMEPDARTWGALLAGCRFHGDIKLAEYAVEHLIKLEPDSGAVLVLLANIYAASGRHGDARNVRLLMQSKGVEKTPGCSSVEVGGRVHQFLVGEGSHPRMNEILQKWDEIERCLKLEGYAPEKKEVLLEVDEEEKEEILARHSEKLAVAFALIATEPGTVIRIIKNLRICTDCHLVVKIVSKVYSRKIIVRDRTRFHIFEEGRCNCNGYW